MGHGWTWTKRIRPDEFLPDSSVKTGFASSVFYPCSVFWENRQTKVRRTTFYETSNAGDAVGDADLGS